MWRTKKSVIDIPRGRTEIEVQAPQDWSDLAIDIAVTRYFRKSGVPGDLGCETSIKKLIERVSSFFGEKFAPEIEKLLLSQNAAFNSPVWFNCGLWQSYGIAAEGENFRFDDTSKTVIPVKNLYEFPQTSACFIQSIKDDLIGIFELATKEAKIFKFGSGTGTNFSTIRAAGEVLENGGRSSGLLSFLEVLDKGAGAVKSGGLARRAAKMVCLDVDHPEIEAFVEWKYHEENKAKALIEKGYSGGMSGEAYRTVSGQNSNNSVRVTDAFMRAVEAKTNWPLRSRTTGEIQKTIKAEQLWQKIAETAWACGDPGLQFHDTIQKWHTCPNSGPIRASNPCSEFMFLDDSACNLASINLLKYLSPRGEFQTADFIKTVRTLIRAQDMLVTNSSYPTEEIAYNSYNFRPLGIGFANLGAFLMVSGIPYDSPKALNWAATITALITGAAYQTSVEMAQEIGPFSQFSKNKNEMLNVIHRHKSALKALEKNVPKEILEVVEKTWSEVVASGEKYGFRNSQVSCIAPTGTIGLVMDCSTMGVEPEYSLVRRKFLIEGDELVIVNSSLQRALVNLGYSDDAIKKVLEYLKDLKNKGLENSGLIHDKDISVFDCAYPTGQGKRYVSAQAQLRMVGAVQPFVSGAVSKTVNLQKDATPEDISQIYMDAWKMSLKSISVYRDTSKSAQPLISS